MTKIATLQVVPSGERDIVLTRRFDAPRALVFDAWIKPELLKRWLLGPPGWAMTECDVDPWVGGSYRFAWQRDAGGAERSRLGMRGVYRAIVRPERIVQTERFDEPWYPGEAEVTVTLAEQRGTTALTVTTRYEMRETRDAVLATGMADGVAASYGRLADLLASAATDDRGAISR
jgi:uncharacterized protein YndB with AHSA1/START domain